MRLSDFDYELPKELIAQVPCEKRDDSRMIVLDKKNQSISHKRFFDIVDLISENDVLVMNNTKVIPARLIGQKVSTGAKIEVFLLKNIKKRFGKC